MITFGTKDSNKHVQVWMCSKEERKQGIYCQRQKDDMDGIPSLHPIYRRDVVGMVQQINKHSFNMVKKKCTYSAKLIWW